MRRKAQRLRRKAQRQHLVQRVGQDRQRITAVVRGEGRYAISQLLVRRIDGAKLSTRMTPKDPSI